MEYSATHDNRASRKAGEDLFRETSRLARLQMHSIWSLMSSARFMVLDVIYRETNGFDASNGDETLTAHPRGISVSTIAQLAHASMPSISRMLGSFEKLGYIERKPDPDDRRNTLVTLTDEGYRQHACTKDVMDEYTDAIVEDLGVERVCTLTTDIEMLAKSMAAAFESVRAHHPDRESGVAFHPPGCGAGCGMSPANHEGCGRTHLPDTPASDRGCRGTGCTPAHEDNPRKGRDV